MSISKILRLGLFQLVAGSLSVLFLGVLNTGTIEEQTHQVLRNLGAVLAAAGSSLHQVVKTTVFLVDLNDFQRMNAVYAGYFSDKPPARSTVQVSKLPLGASIEIECVAVTT